jgi:hypothetical protein
VAPRIQTTLKFVLNAGHLFTLLGMNVNVTIEDMNKNVSEFHEVAQ